MEISRNTGPQLDSNIAWWCNYLVCTVTTEMPRKAEMIAPNVSTVNLCLFWRSVLTLPLAIWFKIRCFHTILHLLWDICGNMHAFPSSCWIIFSSVTINGHFRDSRGQCGRCLSGQEFRESQESWFKLAAEAKAGLSPQLTYCNFTTRLPHFKCSFNPTFYVLYNKMW